MSFITQRPKHSSSQTAMHIKSPYFDLPTTPDANVFHYLWDRADQASWPGDLTLYIDAKSGRKWTYQEFRERVRAAATALTVPVSEGGLGIQAKNEVVAIISQNTVVSILYYGKMVYEILFLRTLPH